MITVAEVEELAEKTHAGQVDKIGLPYIEHPRAVVAGLGSFGDELVMDGLLHDVLEDTPLTAADLLAPGASGRVVAVVETITNSPGVPDAEKVRMIAADRDACQVKIADNAHNSLPSRAPKSAPEKRERLAAKYTAACAVLWPAVGPGDVAAILRRVNPELLPELKSR